MSGSSTGESSGPAGTALPAGSAGSAASAAGPGPAADPTGGGGGGVGAPVVLPAPAVRRRGPSQKPIAVYNLCRDSDGRPVTNVTFLPQSNELREMVTQLGALTIPVRAAPKSAVPAAEKRKRKEELDAKKKEREDAKRKKDADDALLQGMENGNFDGDGDGGGGGGGGLDLGPFRTVEEEATDRYLENLEDSDDAGELPRCATLPEPPCQGR